MHFFILALTIGFMGLIATVASAKAATEAQVESSYELAQAEIGGDDCQNRGTNKKCSYFYKVETDAKKAEIVGWEADLAVNVCEVTCKLPVAKAEATGFTPGCADGCFSRTEKACPSPAAIGAIIDRDKDASTVIIRRQLDRTVKYKDAAALLAACKLRFTVEAACLGGGNTINRRSPTYSHMFAEATKDCRATEESPSAEDALIW